MDGKILIRLRVALAAAVVLGLGGALAPGYARDIAPVPDAAAPITVSADATATLATPDDDSGAAWQTVGVGMASWYGPNFKGHRTASGERFDPAELTAAHRTLPLGTHVRVTYRGRSVVVRINDRGPFAGHRLIDLSRAAAEQIGLRRAGRGRVTLAVLDDSAGDRADGGDVQVADASDP